MTVLPGTSPRNYTKVKIRHSTAWPQPGAIAEEVHDELARGFEQQSDQVKWWINWLGTYCLMREGKGPVPDWAAAAAVSNRVEVLSPERSEEQGEIPTQEQPTGQPEQDEEEAQEGYSKTQVIEKKNNARAASKASR